MSNNKNSARYSDKPWRSRPEPMHDQTEALERQLKHEWQRGKTDTTIKKQH